MMTLRSICLFLLFSVAAGQSVLNARTQEEIPPVPADTLSDAVVTARFVREIAPGQRLSGLELKRLSSLSVTDALRYFSGVQIKDYGGVGGLKTINVRSLGSQHTGVFYDGISVNNAQNGTVDLGRFSMDNMELISLYNGQKSDVFQSARDFSSASALYLVSRTPVFQDGHRTNFTVRMKTGSFGLANPSVLWEQRIGKRISLSVNSEFLYTNGAYPFRYRKQDGYDTTEIRRNGDIRFLRTEAGLFGELPGGHWKAKAYSYFSERGYPGAAVKHDAGIALLNEDRQKDRNLFIQSEIEQRISDIHSYRIRFKASSDYMNYRMPETTTLQPADNHYRQQEVYGSLAWLVTPGKGIDLNAAADLQWNRLAATGTEIFNANFPEPSRLTVLAAAAASWRRNGFQAQASLLYTFARDYSARGMATAPDRSIWTPSLILSYRPFRHTDLTIRGFYKKIFRLPTFNDLYYVQIGSRSLRPEYTTQYDLGIQYRFRSGTGMLEGIEAGADFYFNQIRDKIIATPTSSQLVWTMINLGYVEILGTDIHIAPRIRFGEWETTVRAGYTWQRALDLTPADDKPSGEHITDTYGDQIPYVPVHSGSLTVGSVWRGWNFRYSFIYTGERYMLGGNIPVNRIQPWYTSDLAFGRNFRLGAGNRCGLDATLEINNLFNQQYEVVKWYPMPGTNFKIILALSF